MKGKKPTPAATANETFGARLKRFRLARGWTQTELGDHIGITQRVVAYYEAEGGTPAPELLIKFANALGVTTDVLLGRKQERTAKPAPKNLRLLRQFEQLEQLPPEDRKSVLKMIDALAQRSGRRKTG